MHREPIKEVDKMSSFVFTCVTWSLERNFTERERAVCATKIVGFFSAFPQSSQCELCTHLLDPGRNVNQISKENEVEMLLLQITETKELLSLNWWCACRLAPTGADGGSIELSHRSGSNEFLIDSSQSSTLGPKSNGQRSGFLLFLSFLKKIFLHFIRRE